MFKQRVKQTIAKVVITGFALTQALPVFATDKIARAAASAPEGGAVAGDLEA